MGNSPLVSVFVPCFNHGDYIVECLNSIFKEDYSNFEVIIRDDASKDNSVEKIKSFLSNYSNDKDIKIITEYGETNIGLVNSLNRIYQLSSGEIIMGIASDDLFCHGRIQKTVNIFNSHPEFDILFADAMVINSEGEVVKNSFYDTEGNLPVLKLAEPIGDSLYAFENLDYEKICTFSLGGFSMVFKKKLLSSLGYQLPVGLKYEDFFFTFLGLVQDGILLCTEQLIKYRRTGENLSSFVAVNEDDILKDEIKFAEWNISVIHEKHSYLKKHLFSNNYVQKNNFRMRNILKQEILINEIIVNSYSFTKRLKSVILLCVFFCFGVKRKKSLYYILIGLNKSILHTKLIQEYKLRKEILI